MGKVKNENYFVVQGWMINELKLAGVDLLIFAIIWGFTQNVNSFTGSISYLEEFTGTSRATVIRSLKRLCERKLLEKCTVQTDKGLCCIYKTLECEYQNDTTPSIKMTLPQYQNDTTPSIKMIPNNILYNNNININDNIANDTQNKKEEHTSSLIIPTQEEVIQYVKQRNSCVNPYYFYEYYQNTNWTQKDKKGNIKKIANWKNKLLTWESHQNDKTPYFKDNIPSQDKDIEEQMNNTIQELYDGQDYV